MREILRARLAPFRHRDFRNFFLVQSFSLVGQWSHDLARAWIIVEATGSSGALGNLNLAIAVPCLFLILQGGVLVDRTNVRKLIQWTKSLLAISSLTLAALWEMGELEVWHLLIFGLIEGVIISFDSPAFQALTVRLVPRGDFQQAIALNSTNFHTSRMLGPIVAAWLMALHGPSLVFLFDGITYICVVLILTTVTLRNPLGAPYVKPQKRPSVRDGLKYIYSHLGMRYRILQILFTIACVYPLMISVFRVYVQRKFNLDAEEFGAVFSFPALGAMLGALSFTVVKPRRPIRAQWFGLPLVFVTLLALPWMPNLSLTVAAMSFTGFGLYLTYAALTVSIHLSVEEAYRGRVGSVIGLGFSALGPLMSFPWGHLADYVGAPATIVTIALVFGIFSTWINLAQYRNIQSVS
ncbi:MAG: MFS transporter, partial [Bdellovibrionales bacterium]